LRTLLETLAPEGPGSLSACRTTHRPGPPTDSRRQYPVKNKVEKSEKSSTSKKRPSRHHLLPRIHHKLTTKTPQQTITISQNHLQKHHFTTPEKKS
jgi:hypothetical protein